MYFTFGVLAGRFASASERQRDWCLSEVQQIVGTADMTAAKPDVGSVPRRDTGDDAAWVQRADSSGTPTL